MLHAELYVCTKVISPPGLDSRVTAWCLDACRGRTCARGRKLIVLPEHTYTGSEQTAQARSVVCDTSYRLTVGGRTECAPLWNRQTNKDMSYK